MIKPIPLRAFGCVASIAAAVFILTGWAHSADIAANSKTPAAKPKSTLLVSTTPEASPAVIQNKSTAKATSSAIAQAQQVDRLLIEDVAAADKGNKVLEFSHRANDEVFLRRVYMDLVGRNPSPEEVTAFVLDPAKDKRSQLVDRLHDDPRFGENWGRYWRDVIMYRRSDERAQLAAPALYEYLSEQFNKNTPWDEIARSFITATGDVRENGATGLIMAQDGNTADITAEVSRIFLGVQIQCAQCHDHKTDRWKRTQFHELAAFFPRISLKQDNTTDKRTFNVAGNDDPPRRFGPKQVNRPIGKPEHFMPDLKHPELPGTKMQPVFFLTGQKLSFGTPDAERREKIAEWMTAPTDPWFAKAFVNRIWAEMVGEGFYEPIDDLGPDRTCSAPQTMDYLAKAFIDSHYDVKALYRIIAGTDAYQRESRTRRNPEGMPFAANCPQRLRGDQLYDALVAALGMREGGFGLLGQGKGAGQGKGGALLRSPRNQFNQTFGYDPSTPRDEVSGSIPQALVLMNGPQINREINGNRGTELARLLGSTNDNEAVTTELYLRCLGREPNKEELQTCVDQVKNSKSRSEAFEDILWALVNSTEFLHRR
jgi:hypothetical protein